jgi:hypothetical protein
MRKIAIVVRGATHVDAPWQDKEWEIWGLPWISYPRVDRFFEIHEIECFSGPDPERDGQITANAKKLPDVPCYCTNSRAHLFHDARPYPFEDVFKSLPIVFLEDSVAHMIALAIHEGCDELALYGVHMMGAYASHRPSVTYLVGLAQGRGIKVTIPPGSPLFMSMYVQGRYGISLETR